jgi:hypothetical protein
MNDFLVTYDVPVADRRKVKDALLLAGWTDWVMSSDLSTRYRLPRRTLTRSFPAEASIDDAYESFVATVRGLQVSLEKVVVAAADELMFRSDDKEQVASPGASSESR